MNKYYCTSFRSPSALANGFTLNFVLDSNETRFLRYAMVFFCFLFLENQFPTSGSLAGHSTRAVFGLWLVWILFPSSSCPPSCPLAPTRVTCASAFGAVEMGNSAHDAGFARPAKDYQIRRTDTHWAHGHVCVVKFMFSTFNSKLSAKGSGNGGGNARRRNTSKSRSSCVSPSASSAGAGTNKRSEVIPAAKIANGRLHGNVKFSHAIKKRVVRYGEEGNERKQKARTMII